MVQYLDKFMDMCVVKVMTCKEKSQKCVIEHSVNKRKKVMTILSVSIANTNPATSQRPSAEIPSSNSASEKGVLKDDAVKKYEQQGTMQVVGKSQK